MPLGGLIIFAAVALAYANSFTGVFVMDDVHSIVSNPTIRSLSWGAFVPPGGSGFTVEARPILNFSLALSHALSGLEPWGYHALNLLIHAAAALVLFGWLRRVLAHLGLGHADEIACAVALLWGLHPLQTESVTYVVQRAESLAGLFYLGVLYCQWRGLQAAPGRAAPWLIVAVGLCALGMGTKEVMVTAPVLALLIDRTLVAGSFAVAWRARRAFYIALLGTWLALAALLLGHLDRGGTIGSASGISPWEYALCQARGLLHYAGLGLWPHPLVFDYGADWVSLRQVWWHGLVDLGLLALTARALWRGSAWGLVGAWFFIIMAPTSSVVGGSRQMLAEHRTYLALAAALFLVVVALYRVLAVRLARWSCAAVALAFLLLTVHRNADYHSELALYADGYAKRPDNPHSLYNYGYALQQQGRNDEAIALYRAALRLQPDFTSAHDDLANLLASLPGREAEALAAFEAFLRAKPRLPEVHNNLGVLLLRMPDRLADAIVHFETALALRPEYPEAHFNLAQALGAVPARAQEALPHLEAAVRLKPDYAEAQHNLGLMLARSPDRAAEAIAHLEAAIRARPSFPEAQNNLGLLLVQTAGKPAEALVHFEAALRAEPRFAEAHFNAGMALRFLNRPREAAEHFTAALRLRPDFAAARAALERLTP